MFGSVDVLLGVGGSGGDFFGWILAVGGDWRRRSRERSRRRSEPTRSVSEAATNFPLGKFGLRPLLLGSFWVGAVFADGAGCGG